MIIIIGATGTIGSALLERLVDLGVPARALSREPEKLRDQIGEKGRSIIEVASADASDPESLRRAFTGGSQLFLAMSNSPRQIELETSIIQIAAEAGIKHIVKISSPAFEKSSPVTVAGWHQQIEKTLRDSGLTHTVLRPYAFMQNLLNLAPIYTLTGSEIFSYPQIAGKLSALLDRPIRYINMEPQALNRNLIEHGHMPPWIANHVVEIQAMATVVLERPTDTVKRLLGREPRTLDAFLKEYVESLQ